MTRMLRPSPHSPRHAAIVPPYLLARIAASDDPRFDVAADAARRSLVRDRPMLEWRIPGEPPSFVIHDHAAHDERPAAAPGTAPQPDRRISDAEGDDKLPGHLARREGQPDTGDQAVDEAYDGLGDTFEMFARVFARDSIDDAGMPLEATVHFGDHYDNAVVESFWARMQVELLNRRRWATRVELANAIFEYIEGFHNRRRRHGALRWDTPPEIENRHRQQATTPHQLFRETGS